MMWFPFLIFLISLFGALICDDMEDVDCFLEKNEKCGVVKYGKFPETTDELLTLCQEHVAVYTCQTLAAEQCFGLREEKTDEFKFTEALCDKNNPTFIVLSKNLQCIKQYEKYQGLCDPSQSENKKFSFIDDHMRRFKEKEAPELERCLGFLLMTNCPAIVIGDICNSLDAKEAVREVTQLGMLNSTCPSESMEEMKLIIDEYATVLLDEKKNYK